MNKKPNTSIQSLLNLTKFIHPYRKEAFFALIALSAAVIFDLAIPRLVQRIIDEGVSQQNLQIVIQTSVWMLVATILGAILAITNNIYSIRVAQKTARDLRSTLFRKIQSLSFADLDKYQTGQVLVRLTSDINQVQSVFLIYLRIGTRAPLLMIGSLILLFITSTQLALMMMVIIPVSVLLTFFFAKKMQPLFSIVQQHLDHLNTVLQENLSGMRVVKAFVRADFEKERFDKANLSLTDKNIRVMQFSAFLMPILTLLINLATITAVWFGGKLVILHGMTIGQVVAFVNYLMTTMFPLNLIAMAIGLVSAAMASAERIEEILNISPTVKETTNPKPIPHGNGHIKFTNVDFAYNGEETELVLKNINLDVYPGETLAILGATGSGKSTLLQLISRFYDVTSGKIEIDEEDIRNIPLEVLWKNIGFALQETVLFSGSIADNIRFGRPDANIDEVVQAAKAAQAHDFICNLPEGYQTKVQQRGTNLSGGQKQRIAIARALLVKPRILLLDDSTSAVDVETEAFIHQSLENLMNNRTCFIVAQRISTVLGADKIIVLEKGEIVASGTHQTLLEESEIYREIYQSQLGNGGSLNHG